MKLSIPQPALLGLLARGGSVAPKSHTVPIVNCVRLSVLDDSLYVASTDLDRFAEAFTDATVEAPGTFCVNHAALSALISRYPKDGVVSLEHDGKTLVVKCGRSRVKFSTLPARDFPTWADEEPEAAFAVSGERLASLFGRAKGGMNPGVTTLSSLHVVANDDGLRLAATDRTIAISLQIELPEGAAGAPPMNLPPESLDAVIRVFKGEDSVVVQASRQRVAFIGETVKLASKLIEGSYPTWWLTLLVDRCERKVTFDRRIFLSALDRAVLSSESEGVYAMVIAIPREDGLELKAINSRGGEAREGVFCEITADFEPFAFSPARLAVLLAAAGGDTITIEQVDPKSRYVVTAADDPEFAGSFSTIAFNRADAA